MYRDSYQKGFFTLFYSVGSNPLSNWATVTKNGYIKRIYDEDIKLMVLEVMGTNVSTTFIVSPADCHQVLGIKLPFLIMLVKNLNKYFCFEVKIMDDQNFMRRFRVANFQSKTSVKPFCTAMPMNISPGWNQIQFNLADFTRRAYGSNYIETVAVQIHANVRIRRIYFSDRLYTEDEMPNEYCLLPKVKEPKVVVKPMARPPSPVDNVERDVARATTAFGDSLAAKAKLAAEHPSFADLPPKSSKINMKFEIPAKEQYY